MGLSKRLPALFTQGSIHATLHAMRLVMAIAALVIAFAQAGPAVAQSLQQHLSQCSSGNTELILQGCTALIKSSRLDRKNKAVAYLTRGNAYARLSELDRAIDDFTQAIRRNPRSLAAYYNRGNAHFAQENFDQAIIDLARQSRCSLIMRRPTTAEVTPIWPRAKPSGRSPNTTKPWRLTPKIIRPRKIVHWPIPRMAILVVYSVISQPW